MYLKTSLFVLAFFFSFCFSQVNNYPPQDPLSIRQQTSFTAYGWSEVIIWTQAYRAPSLPPTPTNATSKNTTNTTNPTNTTTPTTAPTPVPTPVPTPAPTPALPVCNQTANLTTNCIPICNATLNITKNCSLPYCNAAANITTNCQNATVAPTPAPKIYTINGSIFYPWVDVFSSMMLTGCNSKKFFFLQ